MIEIAWALKMKAVSKRRKAYLLLSSITKNKVGLIQKMRADWERMMRIKNWNESSEKKYQRWLSNFQVVQVLIQEVSND